MSSWSDLLDQARQFVWFVPTESLLALLWLTLIVEIPRYALGLHAVAAAILLRRAPEPARAPARHQQRISILIAGHNEAATIAACVRSLRTQTYRNIEIICVDDGSTDDTYAIMSGLRQERLVDAVARLDLRGGKSAGLNLAARLATTPYLVVVDCDCSFEPDAIEALARPLLDQPDVGAVAGNILVRNWQASVIASVQAIEYLISISLGKTFSDIFGQVSCVSGAFGAFRRTAWEKVHGMDVGGGEDLDFTLRLRLAGVRTAFARDAICYTDAPETPFVLLRQRARWERDAFWIRFRKFGGIANPFSDRLSWREMPHQWEFILLSVIPSMTFPLYLAWLFATFGAFAPVLLIAIAAILLVLDVSVFACALLVSGKLHYWPLFAFLPVYGLAQSYVLRIGRAYAYMSELTLSLSRTDNYVPQKVREWSRWR